MVLSFYRMVKRFFKNDQHWEDMAFFRHVTIFHGLTSRQLGRIMLAVQKRSYYVGEVLFQEGQVGRALFMIKSGKVELTRKGGDGKTRTLGHLGPGQIFGEMALLEDRPRTAGAHIIEDGEIYLLYTATLESLVRNHPTIGVKLLRNMAVMLSALLRRTNQEMDKQAKAA